MNFATQTAEHMPPGAVLIGGENNSDSYETAWYSAWLLPSGEAIWFEAYADGWNLDIDVRRYPSVDALQAAEDWGYRFSYGHTLDFRAACERSLGVLLRDRDIPSLVVVA